MSITRKYILKQINGILDKECTNCKARKDLNVECNGDFRVLENHCKKICVHGLQLKSLGQKLGRGR